jgi:D-glycero-D-manno-heptose 1,7-bisphosphate phosphatase
MRPRVDDGMHRLRLGEAPRRGCPALFLDRDGTLIEDCGYVSRPQDVVIIPGAHATLRRFRDAGYALVIVTNQSGIGRGLYHWDDYEAVAERVRQIYALEGVAFDAELACGHAPEVAACNWRKPEAGMILAAADRLGLDLGRSVLAGDKASDIVAAVAAGLPRAVHVATGQGKAERPKLPAAPLPFRLDLADDLSELAP